MFAPNLAWRDVDLKADLEARVDLPVVVENDANAAAWGEFTLRRRRTTSTTCCWSPSAPVSAAASCSTASCYRGAFGVGAEIGHMRVVPDGILCGCGNHGCLEQYASGTALVREARAAARGGSLLAQTLLDRAGRRPRADHRAADHRGAPAPATRSPSSSWPRSAAGWARASPR